ncbi:hypothetical protein [Pseudomonas mangiferae]|uniref:Uncharacterized protein n=1 Tax=Pseudomonas mangiferae TaxID=2593654 RepID=A0A553H2F5_9PSED|nr:hypothetical protein [Pseudomonas mangiferae]TRX75944.1 hypothetical protein FM069_05770 [Pseudomonas mangiferae]
MTEPTADSPDAAEDTPRVHPWADLKTERKRLLRLAPLPTDRSSGARPLRFVQLGQAERHSPEQSLLRLGVEVPGQHLRAGQNMLDVWVDHREKRVRFELEGSTPLDPANRGLGRFLLAQGIAWARQKWAHYRVEPGTLAAKDALTEDARLRRDHVLRAQGFELTYEGEAQTKGHFGAGRVSELHPDWNKEKVQFVDLLEAAAMLQLADQNLREQDAELRTLNQRLSTFKRDDTSLRFTIACLVTFAMFQAGLLIWIATH